MPEMSVDYLIRHGAPTLAGIKTGNLFPCSFASREELTRDLRRMNQVLVPRGLRLLPLQVDGSRALLYLFRPASLSRDLEQTATRRILGRAGYPGGGQQDCLRELIRRLRSREGFPHEIGLFLGYPPEDVQGFLDHRGRGFKCGGCWKVYGDEAEARRRFDAYHLCTESYCRRRSQGESLASLTVPTRS